MSTDPSPFIIDPQLIRGERVPLPSGGWVQMRDLDDLRSKHREKVMRAVTEDMEAADVIVMQRAVAEVMILGWELPYLPGAPLPSDMPSILEELSVKDENLLFTKLEAVLDLMNPREVSPDDHDDPDSPTEPAGASEPA